MFWISLVLVGLIAVAAIAYVIAPLRGPSLPLRAEEDDALAELIQRKDEALRAIKEAEFDYHTGKLSQADYERYDQRLRGQAISLISQIEKRSPDLANLDAALEKSIAAQRKVRIPAADAAPMPAPAAAKRVETPVVAAPSPAEAGIFCHQCGAKAQPDDRFCAKCGTPLRVASPADA